MLEIARYIGQRASVTEDKRQVEVFISSAREEEEKEDTFRKVFPFAANEPWEIEWPIRRRICITFSNNFYCQKCQENFRKCKTCQKVIMEIDIHSLW